MINSVLLSHIFLKFSIEIGSVQKMSAIIRWGKQTTRLVSRVSNNSKRYVANKEKRYNQDFFMEEVKPYLKVVRLSFTFTFLDFRRKNFLLQKFLLHKNAKYFWPKLTQHSSSKTTVSTSL